MGIDLTHTTKNIDGLVSSNLTDLYAENALKIIINFSPLDIIYPPKNDTNKQDSTFAHLKKIQDKNAALAKEGNDTAAPIAYEELLPKSAFQKLGNRWRQLVHNKEGVSLKNIYKVALQDSKNIYAYGLALLVGFVHDRDVDGVLHDGVVKNVFSGLNITLLNFPPRQIVEAQL